MTKIRCNTCIFLDRCFEYEDKCEHYSPTFDPMDDNIDYIIESRRWEFYDDVFQYIGEYEDDLFF